MLPQIKHIHYYTDSPTSQYWNKLIFYLLSHHRDLFGSQCILELLWSWPRQRSLWWCWRFCQTQGRWSSPPTEGNYPGCVWLLPLDAATPVFKLFLSPLSPRRPVLQLDQKLRDFESWNLYQVQCLFMQSQPSLVGRSSQEKHHVTVSSASPMADSIPNRPACGSNIIMLKECPEEAEVIPVVGDWVAAAYDDKWYVGKVLAVDLADNDAHKTPQNNLVSLSGQPQPISSGFTSSLSWLLSSLLSLVENVSNSTRWIGTLCRWLKASLLATNETLLKVFVFGSWLT